MKINKLAKEIYKGDTYTTFVNAGLTETNCTGRSTCLALKYIALALESPNKEVHLKEKGQPQDAMAGGFIALVEGIVSVLGLRFMKFNKAKLTLTYELFEEIPDEIDNLGLLKSQLALATLAGNLEAVTTYSQAIQRIQSY